MYDTGTDAIPEYVGGGGDHAGVRRTCRSVFRHYCRYVDSAKEPTQVSAYPKKLSGGGHKQAHIEQKYLWRPIKEALTNALVPGYFYMKLWRTENPKDSREKSANPHSVESA
jgi:hypothetical protein